MIEADIEDALGIAALPQQLIGDLEEDRCLSDTARPRKKNRPFQGCILQVFQAGAEGQPPEFGRGDGPSRPPGIETLQDAQRFRAIEEVSQYALLKGNIRDI